MNAEAKKYALKYAFVYTVIINIILLVPLFIYYVYAKQIFDSKEEIELKEKTHLIITKMEEFNSATDSFFRFPRFQSFSAGLYDTGLHPLFTLIDRDISPIKKGFYIKDGYSYYTLEFPNDRYFGAKYLIITKPYSALPVVRSVFVILLGIMIITFGLSFLVLSNFSRPFRELNEHLDRFICDSMHEINNPLSIIRVNLELFTRKNPDNKHILRIRAATKTLSGIYDDMDYLVKKGRISSEAEVIDFSQTLLERIEYFKDVATNKNIKIQEEIERGIISLFNKKKLERLIDNNISNAIKYSHEDSVLVIVLTEDKKEIIMKFQDYGIGIQNPSKVFERYYRENISKGGFGLGLNIVKQICDEADIKIDVKSEFKVGTTFIYRFPKNIL